MYDINSECPSLAEAWFFNRFISLALDRRGGPCHLLSRILPTHASHWPNIVLEIRIMTRSDSHIPSFCDRDRCTTNNACGPRPSLRRSMAIPSNTGLVPSTWDAWEHHPLPISVVFWKICITSGPPLHLEATNSPIPNHQSHGFQNLARYLGGHSTLHLWNQKSFWETTTPIHPDKTDQRGVYTRPFFSKYSL